VVQTVRRNPEAVDVRRAAEGVLREAGTSLRCWDGVGHSEQPRGDRKGSWTSPVRSWARDGIKTNSWSRAGSVVMQAGPVAKRLRI